MKRKIITVIRLIEKHWVLMTGCLAALGIIVEIVLRTSAYISAKGYCDFWEIPYVYIDIDYRTFIFKFFENLISIIAMLTITFGWCLLIQKGWRKVSEKGKGIKTLFFLEILGSVLTINIVLIYLLGIFYCHYTLLEIAASIRGDLGGFLYCMFILLMFELGVVILIWTFAKWVIEEEEFKEEEKEECVTRHLSYRKKVQILLLIVVIFSATVGIESMLIYGNGKDRANQVSQLDVVTMEEKSYVVVEQNDGVGILVPCSSDEEGLVIHVGEYMFSNLSGYTIRRVSLSRKVESYFDSKN